VLNFLYLLLEVILTLSAFFLIGCLILHIFFNHCSICFLKVAATLYLGSEHRLRRIVSSSSVQGLNKAAPLTFRMSIEQIQTHLEQPPISLKQNKKFECLMSHSLRNLNAC
jgi:hypothetical protein